MKFERTGDSEHPYAITFEVFSEVEVVAAAFKEAIYRRAEKGNSGSISEFDAYAASGDGDELRLKLRSIDSVTDILDEFHLATDEAIVEIPDVSQDPPYINDHIPERFTLGQKALVLADQIREAASKPEDSEETVKRFVAELDSAFPTDQ